MRYNFNEIFQENNGALSPLRQIRVGGITFGPGVTFGSGVAFGGIDFFQFKGHQIEAEEKDGILIISGIYGI